MTKHADDKKAAQDKRDFPVYDGRGDELMRAEKPPPGTPFPGITHIAMVIGVFIVFIVIVLIIRRRS